MNNSRQQKASIEEVKILKFQNPSWMCTLLLSSPLGPYHTNRKLSLQKRNSIWWTEQIRSLSRVEMFLLVRQDEQPTQCDDCNLQGKWEKFPPFERQQFCEKFEIFFILSSHSCSPRAEYNVRDKISQDKRENISFYNLHKISNLS